MVDVHDLQHLRELGDSRILSHTAALGFTGQHLPICGVSSELLGEQRALPPFLGVERGEIFLP